MLVRKRKLQAESLESRRLLHGRGLGNDMSTEDRIAAAFDRMDTNDDGVILVTEEGGEDSDSISDRVWGKVAVADGDDEGQSVSLEEWTAHLEAEQAEREAAKLERTFNRLDTNGDGVILVTEEGGEGSDRLPSRTWQSISAADGDDEGAGVDLQEFTDFVEEQEAQREAEREARREERERQQAEREAARVERTFNRLDTNDDGVILVTEEGGEGSDRLPERTWAAISEADGEDEGAGVDLTEFAAWLEARENERPDRGGDGGRQERPDRHEGGRSRVNVEAAVERLFAQLDGDENGVLSADELGRLAERLADANTDGEEGLTTVELTDYINKLIADRMGDKEDDDSDGDGEDTDDSGGEVVEAAAVQRGPSRAIMAARSRRR